MRRLIYTVILNFLCAVAVLAQDPAPVAPIAVSPNYTWYKKILPGDTSIFAYSNGQWANIARREWVKKAIKDSLAKDKFVPYQGAKTDVDLGDKAISAGTIVTTTAGATGKLTGDALKLSSPTLGNTTYSFADIKSTANGFIKILKFGDITNNRLLKLPDTNGVLAVDESTVHKYGDEEITGHKTFDQLEVKSIKLLPYKISPIWSSGTNIVTDLSLQAANANGLTIKSIGGYGNALNIEGTLRVQAGSDLHGISLDERMVLKDRIQTSAELYDFENFAGNLGLVNHSKSTGLSLSPDGKVYVKTRATPTSSMNTLMFAGHKIQNVSTNKYVVFQGDTLTNLEATSIKNQATLNSGFLKTDASGLIINGGYTPANAANVISKNGYADQVFNGNLGAGDGYIQTTNSGSGRIGRIHGSMFSDIGTINNLNLATNGGYDATLSAINNINFITGTEYSVRANNFSIIGNSGPGIRLYPQSTPHASPGIGQQDIYTDASGRFTMMGSNGFAASFGTTALLANQVYSFPNSSGTLALKESPISTFYNDAGYLTTVTADSRYPQLANTYNNPSWLNSVAYNKVSSIPANTILANTTSSAGSAIGITYVDNGPQEFTGNVAWTATTAPSGTTSHTYQWTQIGKMVTLRMTLVYSVAGNSVQDVMIDLPSDLPTPTIPNGFAATDNINAGYGGFATATVNPITQATRIGLTRRSGIWKLRSVGGATNAAVAHLTITYYTN